MSDPKKALKDAIKETEEWVTKGWPMGFGIDSAPVNSVKEAKELPDSFVYKIEANSYWGRVEYVSEEALVWANRALAALEKGDMHDALDCAYSALFIERGFRESIPTWGPALEAMGAGQPA